MDLEKLKAIFGEASAISSPEARAAYLDEACAGDDTLRERVESLLAASAKLGNFLETPFLSEDRLDL